MKRLTLTAIALIWTLASWAQADFETAAQAVSNMKIGWNLGNSLDSHRTDVLTITDCETLRGQPVTRPELMEMMKMAGFNAVRVPVTWYPHLYSNGSIKAEWLNRVQEVVDYVINQGMYCIINVHHDTGKDTNAANSNKGWIKADPDNFTQNQALFEQIWRQIANRFRNYDHHLLFEGYNEMFDKYNSSNFAAFSLSSGYSADEANAAYDAVNSYAASFVNTVRATGGNNATRNLIINTYGACEGRGTWSNHLTEPLSQLVLPEQGNHLIVGVHSYPPIVNKDNDGNIIGDRSMEDIRTNVNSMFSNLNTHIINRLGVPVIIGEWSTSEIDNTPNDYDNRRELMLEFVDYFVKQAKANGITTFYWMGLSDRLYRAVPMFNEPELADVIMKAYYGNDYQPMLLSFDDLQYSDVNFSKQYAELRLAEGDDGAFLPSVYTGVEVQLAEMPANSGNLSFRVYTSQQGYINRTNVTALNNTLTFSSVTSSPIRLASIVWRSTGTASLKIKHAYLIKNNGEKVEILPSNLTGCSITYAPNYTKVRTENMPATTLYYSDRNLTVPPMVSAAAYRIESDLLVQTHTYNPGDVIPAGVPAVISGDANMIYKFSHTGNAGTAPAANALHGSDNEQTTQGDLQFRLSVDDNNSVVFTAGSEAVTLPAHQAYLIADQEQASSATYFLDDAIPDGVDVNDLNFPDLNFRNYVKNTLAYTLNETSVKPGLDGSLSVAEIASVANIDCRNLNIASLEGIRYFPKLNNLNCNSNPIGTIDLTHNKALKVLNCSSNNLTALDLSRNRSLEQLWCSSNPISTLDLTHNTALFELRAVQMPSLQGLDVTSNTALKLLYCQNSNLTSLNLRNNSNLNTLHCFENAITTLDLSRNYKLTALVCRNNGMKQLTLPPTEALTWVNCQDNLLTELNLSRLPKLSTLLCKNNRLTALDLSANTSLTQLDYSGQERDEITAESAEMFVGYDSYNNPVKERIFYLRLDNNVSGDSEQPLVQRFTDGNYGNTPSTFLPQRVLVWTGGTYVHGKKNTPIATSVDPALVKGDILLLTDINENDDNTVGGTVTYTYDTQSALDNGGSLGSFTLHWTADNDPSVITALIDLSADSEPVEVTYVDPLGRVSPTPFAGVNIIVTRYRNGAVTTRKELR